MFHPFISTAASRPRITRASILSTAIHVSLLGLAIAPLQPARYTSVPRAVGERVQFMTTTIAYHGHARHPRARESDPHTSEPQKSEPHKNASPATPQPVAPPVPISLAMELPAAIAPPETTPEQFVDTLWLTSGTGALSNAPGAAATKDAAELLEPESDVYVAANVERSAVSLPENPKPEYPRDLLRRNIETSFIVFFVVDTTGRIDKSTIQVPPSVQDQFASAVRSVIVRWHFLPAQRGGRHVRQLVEQPFSFRIVDAPYNRRAGLRMFGSPQ